MLTDVDAGKRLMSTNKGRQAMLTDLDKGERVNYCAIFVDIEHSLKNKFTHKSNRSFLFFLFFVDLDKNETMNDFL